MDNRKEASVATLFACNSTAKCMLSVYLCTSMLGYK